MSLASEVNNLAIDSLVQSSLESENEDLRLKWIPYEGITNVKPTQIDNVYCASRKRPDGKVKETMLLLLGSSKECTSTLVSEFARKYSLPTHEDIKDDVNQFRRYTTWLYRRNELIIGFTKLDGSYYMVAD